MKKKSENLKSETRWVNDYEKSNTELKGTVKFKGENPEETGSCSLTLFPGPKTFTLDEVIKIIDSCEMKRLDLYQSWDTLDDLENYSWINKSKLIKKFKSL
jgi:hypothetical protein